MSGAAPAVFLDRDGTLIEDVGFLSDPGKVRVLPGVPDALRRLRAGGFLLVLATNQSGIGRGLFTETAYAEVNAAMLRALGVPLDGAYHCPHAPEDGCGCRKPEPGLLRAAARDLGLALPASWMVGDAERDALAGLAAGCRAVRIGGGAAPAGADAATDLGAAADLILGGDR